MPLAKILINIVLIRLSLYIYSKMV